MSIAQRLKEAWETHDPAQVAALYAEDGVREEFLINHAVLTGREEITQHVGGYMHAVPDCALDIRRVVEGADGTITLEWTWGGTHSGEIPGLPARGQSVSLQGTTIYDMDGDLIARENLYCDFAIMLASAGLLGG
ncbi:MAG: hypothetical protein QOD86_1882 [Miltoncostaeaceae bacterium]|jgi:steroid delta-isomerase-like uncharacterized protein|nr:hypothetical protein [Miltoncostaeaceae bacterium]